MKHMRRIIYYGVVILLACCSIGAAIKVLLTLHDLDEHTNEQDDIRNIVETVTSAEESVNDDVLSIPLELKRVMHAQTMNQAALNELKKINSDTIGYFQFDNADTISVPFLKTTNNTYYMSHTFYKQYSTGGAFFMNYECTLNDKNLVTYGHNSDYNYKFMMAPLNSIWHKTIERNENRYFSFYLDNEVRRYKIAYMFDYGDFRNFDHQRWDFVSEDDFNEWIAEVERRNGYDSEEHITYNDNFVTIQTCLRSNSSRRLIVIGKEIGRYQYIAKGE